MNQRQFDEVQLDAKLQIAYSALRDVHVYMVACNVPPNSQNYLTHFMEWLHGQRVQLDVDKLVERVKKEDFKWLVPAE